MQHHPLPHPLAAVLTCLGLAVASPPPLPAQVTQAQAGVDHGSLGTVDFEATCTPAVKDDVDTAVALLHHMMYEESRAAFEGIIQEDPDCAAAHWGLATTLFQPLWPARPDAATRQRGWDAVERARELEPDTPRERLLLNATAAFFQQPEDEAWWPRIQRWADALEEAHRERPNDVEIAAFRGLSLLAAGQRSEDPLSRNREAAEILAEAHAREPLHPGLIHYTIHADDATGRASEHLQVVEQYGEIAPDVPHALHMPSHIYVRLGDWPAVIHWNRRSAEAALTYPAGNRTSLHHVHALDYLLYARLQQGDDASASRVLEEAASSGPYQEDFASAFHLAIMPARFVVERRAWNEAADLRPNGPGPLSDAVGDAESSPGPGHLVRRRAAADPRRARLPRRPVAGAPEPLAAQDGGARPASTRTPRSHLRRPRWTAWTAAGGLRTRWRARSVPSRPSCPSSPPRRARTRRRGRPPPGPLPETGRAMAPGVAGLPMPWAAPAERAPLRARSRSSRRGCWRTPSACTWRRAERGLGSGKLRRRRPPPAPASLFTSTSGSIWWASRRMRHGRHPRRGSGLRSLLRAHPGIASLESLGRGHAPGHAPEWRIGPPGLPELPHLRHRVGPGSPGPPVHPPPGGGRGGGRRLGGGGLGNAALLRLPRLPHGLAGRDRRRGHGADSSPGECRRRPPAGRVAFRSNLSEFGQQVAMAALRGNVFTLASGWPPSSSSPRGPWARARRARSGPSGSSSTTSRARWPGASRVELQLTRSWGSWTGASDGWRRWWRRTTRSPRTSSRPWARSSRPSGTAWTAWMRTSSPTSRPASTATTPAP
jgi:hypothetical protein